MPSTPFPQLSAIQIHEKRQGQGVQNNMGEIEYEGDSEATLFYKYYNGGSLAQLCSKYYKTKEPVPEGFIWHFIAQIGRALSWLHTGHIPSREENLKQKADIYVPGKAVNKARPAEAWEPICHHDAHMENIWLHYPSDEERQNAPQLMGFTDSLPQIILGDYGMAFQTRNDRIDMLGPEERRQYPEGHEIHDKAYFGDALVRLVLAAVPPEHRWRFVPGSDREDGIGPDATEASKPESDLQHWLAPIYSERLVMCCNKFLAAAKIYHHRVLHGTPEYDRVLQDYPHHDFAYGTMIAMADVYLDKHTIAAEPVRWTQPAVTYMPYHNRIGNRWPRQHRRDYGTVHKYLNDVVSRQFHTQFTAQSVEICEAHTIGAGTPDEELEEVNEHHPQSPPRSTRSRPPPAPTSTSDSEEDELPSYESSEQSFVGAKRVTLVPGARRRHHRIESPPHSPEYRKRKADQAALYERRCREMVVKRARKEGRRS
jgi:hypothetical protein